MSQMTNAYGISANPVEKAFEDEGQRLEQVADVKTDISFVSIFANLIRKMDDAAQSAV
jgi:hypothetical protein